MIDYEKLKLAHELSDKLTDINRHQFSIDINRCQHESDGLIYTSNPPQNKCKKCGEFY